MAIQTLAAKLENINDLTPEQREEVCKAAKERIIRLERLADAIMNNDGIQRCLDIGCEKCSYNGNGCKSRAVVDALKLYRYEEENE